MLLSLAIAGTFEVEFVSGSTWTVRSQGLLVNAPEIARVRGDIEVGEQIQRRLARARGVRDAGWVLSAGVGLSGVALWLSPPVLRFGGDYLELVGIPAESTVEKVSKSTRNVGRLLTLVGMGAAGVTLMRWGVQRSSIRSPARWYHPHDLDPPGPSMSLVVTGEDVRVQGDF